MKKNIKRALSVFVVSSMTLAAFPALAMAEDSAYEANQENVVDEENNESGEESGTEEHTHVYGAWD